MRSSGLRPVLFWCAADGGYPAAPAALWLYNWGGEGYNTAVSVDRSRKGGDGVTEIRPIKPEDRETVLRLEAERENRRAIGVYEACGF